MQLPLYVVDAFTSQLFHGNPAAVCPLTSWLPDALMQQIAAENNLSETAFLVPEGACWRLRWFTPLVEIDLCGHATLASTLVLSLLHPQQQQFRFLTRSGELVVTHNDTLFTLDFPQLALAPLPHPEHLAAALGVPVVCSTSATSKLIAELTDAASVASYQPDFGAIRQLNCSGLIITARGEDCDFVSRYFAPKVGVNEDPVTGSAHCALVPFWSRKLGKTNLHARQVSARGGELFCEYRGERVLMSGHGVLYSHGIMNLASLFHVSVKNGSPDQRGLST